jgi:hypothetical protein
LWFPASIQSPARSVAGPCHREERSDAAISLTVRTFMGIAASLALLAMTAKGFADASPGIKRTAALPGRMMTRLALCRIVAGSSLKEETNGYA